MAITNSDALPQVNVTVNDGGLRVAPPQLGPKLTILGATSNTGITTNEIYVVSDLAKAVTALRNADGTPSELSLAVEEAFAAGARNVEVMKIAAPADLLDGSDDYDSNQRYTALSTAYDVLLNHPVDIVVPVGAWADDRDLTTGDFGKQLADFCFQSTKENNSGFGVIAPMHPAVHAQVAAASFGTDWTSYSEATSNFGDVTLAQLTAWVADLTTEDANNPLDAYLSGSDSNDYDNAYKNAWTASEGTLGATGSAVDGNGLWIDAGQFVSIIAAPNRYVGPEARKLASLTTGHEGKNFVNTDGAVAYAAKLTTLDPHMAATNQTIFGQRAARSLSASQAKSLLNARFVSMFTKPSGYVISSAITGAHNASTTERSDFVRVTTVRITQAVIDAVRDAGEAFIGKPISTPYVNAMDAQIESTLSNIARVGAIRSYDFAITSSPDQQVLGEVSVSLTIVPAFELTTVNATVSLTKGEGIG